MVLPFTEAQFFGVFRAYNTAVWPAQLGLLGLAAAAVALVFARPRWAGVAISAILAGLWVWLALAYHLAFFAAINPLAPVFAAVSLAGAAAFGWHGVLRRRLVFGPVPGARGAAGALLIAYALLVYPLWSTLSGHGYPTLPTFGLPCPTTLFTLGLLACLQPPYPRSVLLVPLAWCLVGVQAAVLFGVQADLGLVAAAALGAVLLAGARAPSPR